MLKNIDNLFTEENILKAIKKIKITKLANSKLGSKECVQLAKELAQVNNKLKQLK